MKIVNQQLLPFSVRDLWATLVAVLVAGLLFVTWPALAQDAKDPTRALQLRLRQAEQAKSQLTQQKSELDEQVKATEKRLEQSQRGAEGAVRARAGLARELAAAAVEKAELTERLAEQELLLAQSQTKLAETQASLEMTAGLLSRSETTKRQLADSLAKKTQALSDSASKNELLFKVGESLVAELAAKTGSSGLQSEPVTGLGRVILENRVEAYREQLEQQRLAQQQAAEEAQRLVVAQRIEAHQAALAAPQKRKLEQERVREGQLKQQAKLDSWTHKIKSIFENVEW